ncbi:hypothetical protein [Aureimonas sp. AU20]|uniref:hypothetical protein n=1 Tax=Aureimonas sp. AU20 TaxID=1349819 RepID=UPI00071FDDB7|nr:hypothetical protein [Aureimonas sp. AU20]ALN74193.1 hypothetical protein M673_15805 [Aureimonas sp. AU20]
MRADPELSQLIADVIDAGLLKAGSREIEIAQLVARQGQRRLTPEDRHIWENGVLPVLAKPIDIQIAVRSLERRSYGLAPRPLA